MIFKEINSLFIHIPKCAGSTVTSRIGEYFHGNDWDKVREKRSMVKKKWAQHWGYQEYAEHISQDLLDGMFKFTFVRNPWDRAVSEFMYVKSSGCSCNKKKVSQLDFQEFVERGFLCSYGRHKLPQKKFITNSKGEIVADAVFRFEDFEKDFSFLARKFNLKDKRCLNRSFNRTRSPSQKIKKPYWEYYNSKTKILIDSMYMEDIEYFNYTFGD